MQKVVIFYFFFSLVIDSVSLLKIQDAILSYERLIELKKNHCRLLKGKVKKLENKVSGLKKELSEVREVKSQLEHQKVEGEQECCSLRYDILGEWLGLG